MRKLGIKGWLIKIKVSLLVLVAVISSSASFVGVGCIRDVVVSEVKEIRIASLYVTHARTRKQT